MRNAKKLLTLLLTATLVTAMPGATVFAADAAYTYKVTVYAGNVGEINGTDSYVQDGLAYGESTSLYEAIKAAAPTDEKYYVMGVRLAGRDNLEENASGTATSVDASAFRVTEDVDYVIAYGIKGEMVAYTVNYVDEDGNALLDSDTFYGNVGDKPVAAYRYIDGYTPDTLAITKTLSSNEAENVFTFTYTQNTTSSSSGGSSTTTTTTVVTTVVESTEGGGTTTTTTTGGGAGGGGAAGGGAAGGGAGENAGGGEDLTNIEDNQTPTDLTDLDEIGDEETPEANIDLNDDVEKGLPLAGLIGISTAAVAAILAALVLFLRRRKSEDEE